MFTISKRANVVGNTARFCTVQYLHPPGLTVWSRDCKQVHSVEDAHMCPERSLFCRQKSPGAGLWIIFGRKVTFAEHLDKRGNSLLWDVPTISYPLTQYCSRDACHHSARDDLTSFQCDARVQKIFCFLKRISTVTLPTELPWKYSHRPNTAIDRWFLNL